MLQADNDAHEIGISLEPDLQECKHFHPNKSNLASKSHKPANAQSEEPEKAKGEKTSLR